MKPKLIKLLGTGASFLAGGGAVFAPEPYREILVGLATLVLGWLHLPQPGTVKVAP